jgi:hypothetical protein
MQSGEPDNRVGELILENLLWIFDVRCTRPTRSFCGTVTTSSITSCTRFGAILQKALFCASALGVSSPEVLSFALPVL